MTFAIPLGMLSSKDKTPRPSGWGHDFHHATPVRHVRTVAGELLVPRSADDLPPVSAASLCAIERAAGLLSDLLSDPDHQAFLASGESARCAANMQAHALAMVASGDLRPLPRIDRDEVDASKVAANDVEELPPGGGDRAVESNPIETSVDPEVTDEQIRACRDDHRAACDQDVVRCCNAALGLPTGDGALGLLDAATCRARIASRIAADGYYAIEEIRARQTRSR